MRGIKTLPLRMKQQSESARTVATWLAGNPRVSRVNYPGLEDLGPAEAIFNRPERGGMISFEIADAGRDDVFRFFEALRLVVPGVQGVSWVKYLRRIEVGDMPYAAKDEAIHYLDLMPDGLHRQYTSIQECKSVVTTPSGGQVLLDKGFYTISGLAWSTRLTLPRPDQASPVML